MKRYGALFAFLVAIGFGVLAVMLASKYMQGRGLDVQPVIQAADSVMIKVVVAAKDLDVGAMLTPEALTVVDWPRASAPKGFFSSVADLDKRVAVVRLVTGEPLLAAELAAPNSGIGLVATIPPGMRLMSIPVNEVIGVSGFILPNTYVDILTVNAPTEGNQANPSNVSTILERIKVLAIGQETVSVEGKPQVVRTVTVEASTEQVEILLLYTTKGAVNLVLRNPLDTQKIVAAPKVPPPPPLQETITPAKRAVSIKVDEVIGVSGFILPDSLVDVLSVTSTQAAAAATVPSANPASLPASTPGPQTASTKVTTILQGIKVLAIDRETISVEGKPRVVSTVTLEVTPAQGEKLVQHKESLHLTLRNQNDTQKIAITDNEPTPANFTSPVGRPEAKPKWVDIIMGKEHQKLQF